MDLTEQISLVSKAYMAERWHWETAPPSACDASYFRLHKLLDLDAPAWIIEREIALLRHKIALMQMNRLGQSVH